MRVLVAIDSFKGSLSSLQAGSAVKDAVLKVDMNSSVAIIPLADGGEGTVDALSSCLDGEIIETNEEIKTFDIEVAKMLYSMLDGKLTMK